MSEDVIEDFPRGGAQILTPLEVRKIRDTAKKDVLFGVTKFCSFCLFLFNFYLIHILIFDLDLGHI